jgi:hypothetical protein
VFYQLGITKSLFTITIATALLERVPQTCLQQNLRLGGAAAVTSTREPTAKKPHLCWTSKSAGSMGKVTFLPHKQSDLHQSKSGALPQNAFSGFALQEIERNLQVRL